MNLGRLLELLHTAHQGVRTVQCRYVFHHRPVQTLDIVLRQSPVDDAIVGFQRPAGGTDPGPASGARCVWWDPRREWIRVDVSSMRGDLLRTEEADATHWLWWERGTEPKSGMVTPGDGPGLSVAALYNSYLDPAPLLAEYVFHPLGEGSCAGTPSVVARAWRIVSRPRATNTWVDFTFDRQHGTVLRRVDYFEGRATHYTEAVLALYDEAIGADVLRFPGSDD
jgi:hypothetical protein